MITERPRTTNLPGVQEPEYLRVQRLENLARERQNAFQSEKAQRYWSLNSKQLASYWQDFFASRIKVEPGMNIDVPIVPRCPFSEELLLEFSDRRTLTLFIPSKRIGDKEENTPIADLDQIFAKAKVLEAINKNPVVDSGSFGWTVVKPLVDPPYRGKSRVEMQEIRRRSNIARLGLAGYLTLADFVEEITGHRIDSAENNSSRLFPVSIGGFQSPTVGFDNNGKLKIVCLGSADTHKQDNWGWR